jgi:hypothetical protein
MCVVLWLQHAWPGLVLLTVASLAITRTAALVAGALRVYAHRSHLGACAAPIAVAYGVLFVFALAVRASQPTWLRTLPIRSQLLAHDDAPFPGTLVRVHTPMSRARFVAYAQHNELACNAAHGVIECVNPDDSAPRCARLTARFEAGALDLELGEPWLGCD